MTCPNRLTSSWSAEVGHGLELERAGLHDAGIVHQARDAVIAHDARDGLGGGGDHRLVGDVDEQRRERSRCLRRERLGVGGAAHAGEDREPGVGETQRARSADARGRPVMTTTPRSPA